MQIESKEAQETGKGYNYGMRVRAVLGFLLSMGLLVVPALASACDLSCSLQQIASECRAVNPLPVRTETPAPMSPRPGLHHHHHSADNAKSESAPNPVHDYSKGLSFCLHEPCSQTSASASSASRMSPSQFVSAQWHGVETVFPPAPYIEAPHSQGESPQIQITASDPPLLSLRI
jgi:hypothetical protein